MLNTLALRERPAEAGRYEERNPLTRGRFMASALFNPFVHEVVRRQSPSHGLTTLVDRFHGATR